MLEKTLESPLDCNEIQPVHPKEISPGCSLEGLMLKLKLQYFGHLMQRANSLEKTLMLGKIEGTMRERRQRRRWLESITDSMDMSLSKPREMVRDQEAWYAAVHRVVKRRTQLGNRTRSHPTSLPLCTPIHKESQMLFRVIPAAAAAKSLQSCPTLCDPTDSSPPGSAIPGIL